MKSEYANLIELVLAQGVAYSKLIEEIQVNILIAYKKSYPKAPIDSTIFIDEASGQVRLMSDGRDITPQNFASTASQIARMTLISYLTSAKTPGTDKKNVPETPQITNTTDKPIGKSAIANFLSLALFWGYNGLYLLFMAVFILGLATSDLRHSLIDTFKQLGSIRSFLFVLLLTTPVAIIIFSIREKLHKQPEKLGKLFFLLEIPLLILIYFPLSISVNLTPIMWFFTLMLLFIPPTLYFYEDISKVSSTVKLTILMSVQELLAMVSIYLTALLAFFAPLILGGIASELFRGFFSSFSSSYGAQFMYAASFSDIIGRLILFAFGTLLLLVVSTLILLPFLITYLFIKSFLSTRKNLAHIYDERKLNRLNIVFAIVVFVVTIGISYQPKTNQLLNKLGEFSLATKFAEKETLARIIVPHESELKEAILDMSDASRRFLFTKDDISLARSYEDVFQLKHTLAEFVQKTFLTIAYPFVYQGSSNNYNDLAQQFTYVFGYSPQTQDNYKPQLQENVRVVNRTIRATTDTQNPLATVTFEETYENKVWSNQEVVYEFSLPNEAVITDLKLGPNLEFPGIIAPIGAAQKTYERELQRSRDPALLEQIGPRQYRLRVFPIPAKNDTAILNGKLQKVQFTYVVGFVPDGIPLPKFSKKTNVGAYTPELAFVNDKKTANVRDEYLEFNSCESRFNGQIKLGSQAVSLVPHELLDGNRIRPLCVGSTQNGDILNAFYKGNKIALFYDVSSDNREDNFGKTVKQHLERNGIYKNNTYDLYLYNDHLSEKKPVTADLLSTFSPVYFGKSDVLGALKNLPVGYDAIMVINSSKSLNQDNTLFTSVNVPVYFIQTRGIPSYTQILTAKIIQSHGLVTESITEALNHLALKKQLYSAGTETLYIGPYWSLMTNRNASIPSVQNKVAEGVTPQSFMLLPPIPPPPPIDSSGWENMTTSADNPLSYIVAHAYFAQKLTAFPTSPSTSVSFLDASNAFAVQTHIITPYSSLIALVNEQQKLILEQNSQGYDRYEEKTPPEIITQPLFSRQPSLGIMDNFVGIELLQDKTSMIPTIESGGGINTVTPRIYRPGNGFSMNILGGSSLILVFIVFTALIFISGLTFHLMGLIRKKT